MEGKISVIIPAYNTEQYIDKCLESILGQTYSNFEIILVNDGSTDNTLERLKEYENKYECIRVIDITNHGQGYARNLALKEAKGEYVFFMDSDDWIEKVTFQVAVERIKEDNSDFVFFDWKYFFDKNGKYKYMNTEKFFNKKILEGKDVLNLFTIQHYFTVNKLYSKKFLLENEIKYGEGYIYEDNPFWVKVVNSAKKVSIIHSPLYIVRLNKSSSTKTKFDTDKHCSDFIKAITAMMDIINEKPENNYVGLYNYIMKKFNMYYKKRTPRKYKRKFIYDFVEQMSRAVEIREGKIKNSLIRIGFKYDIFKNKKKKTFYIIYKIYVIKNILKRYIKAIEKRAKKLVKKVLNKNKVSVNMKEYKLALNKEKQNTILFMGFDYRYTGNSRYLFESIKEKADVFFVTEDEHVEEKYRIKPKSKEMYEKLYNSKVVVFESWIPKQFKKMEDSIWIQLWHGTPLKKMLYDSEEAEIITKNKNHKINKYDDIARWDYLLADNKEMYKYFETSFLMPESKALASGYPRVKYLLDNIENKELKQKIKDESGIDKSKKVVLYLPTWRDYNYGKSPEQSDFEYMLDANKLQKSLGDEYVIVSKNHTFLNNKEADAITNVETETQELLLVADYLVTDYSSVMFDAFPIDLPVVIMAKDFEKYEQSRGVYKDMWKDLLPLVVSNEEEVATRIKEYNVNNKDYEKIKQIYGYRSDMDLIGFILNDCIKGGN